MRAAVRTVVLLAFVAGACGKKGDDKQRREPAPVDWSADEQFVNADLNVPLAQLEAAAKQLDAIQPADVTRGASLSRELAAARGHVTELLLAAGQISPPAAWKASLDNLVAIATELVAKIDNLQMAVDAGKADMFAASHAELAETLRRFTDWQTAFTNGLAAAKITRKAATLPAAGGSGSAAPPDPCGGPCPCTASSIVQQGDVITSCVLSRDYGVSGIYCAAGKVTFHADTGELATCDAATAFSPFLDISCGPGPVTRGPTSITSCIRASDKLKLVLDEKGRITRTITPRGQESCFDASGATKPC